MARFGTRTDLEGYYPPRARWFSRIFFNAFRPVRRYLHTERFRLRFELKLKDVVLCLAIPGFGFFARGRRLAGWVAVAGYAIAAIVFLAALGFSASSIAYGLMISIHASSILYLELRWLYDASFRKKLVVALGTPLAVWAILYAPLVGFAERHWMMPLRIADRVIVVNCGVTPRSLKRGDWVAYRIPEDIAVREGVGRAYLAGGIGLDPAIGLPGDHVRFAKEAVFVNDQPFLRAQYMPASGEMKVPEKVWFIWPHLAITMRGGAFEADISATLQQTAMVAEKQIIGRPFKHWFGRRQSP